MQTVFLHSAQVESSRAIMAQLGGEPVGVDVTINHEGREIRVLSKHSLATGVCPNFSAYPAIVVTQDDGGQRVKSPVDSWAQCLEFIDSPPAATPAAKQTSFPRLEFLGLFTEEEKVSLKALESVDPTVALFWEEFRSADTISLTDPRTIRAVEYLSAQGYLGAGRKEEILGL